MDDCLEKVTDAPTAKMMEGPMGDNDRTRARMAQARRRLKKAVYTMTNQLARGDFKLYRSEVEFGEKDGQPTLTLILEDGERIRLRGKIDRVDQYVRNDETYYRVIDYKSSEHKLNPTAVWSGLQLQLLLYLDAICRTKQNAKPAGAFYFCIDDPVVDGVAPVNEAEAQQAAISIRNKVDQKLNLKGFVLRDPEICKAMDHKDDERNLVLPKIFNGKGPEFDRNARVLDEDQMDLLLEHTRDTAAHLAFELFSGRDDIRPTAEDDKRPCEWCDYKRICEIDSYHTIQPGEPEKMTMAGMCEALSEMQKNKQSTNPAVK